MSQSHKKHISFITVILTVCLFALLFVTNSFASAQKQPDRNPLVHNQELAGFDMERGYNPVQVLVRLTPDAARRAQKQESVASLGRTVLRDRSVERPISVSQVVQVKDINHPLARWFTLEFKTAEQAERFMKQAETNRWIESVDRDVVHSVEVVPQDEFLQPSSGQSLWGHEMINAQDLWDVLENPGEGVIVAVVDTGVSNAGDLDNPWTHLDLLGSEWVGPDGTILGSSPASIAPVWEDYNGHGTHVAGTIGARTNEFGLPGIAFDSTIMAYKLSNGGSWASSTSVAGIVYAVENGASIINASFGSTRNTVTDDAVKYAFDNDVLFVAAAGNNYGTNVCNQSPAGSEYALAVSAVDKNRNISNFSNIGTGIDVAAPGGGSGTGSQNRILSTATKSPNGIASPVVDDSQGEPYTAINGTSMATPHVAAAAAIIRQVRPTWNVEEVWAGVRFIADEEPGSDFDDGFGHGVINLAKIADLPETIPVAQLYSPQNCFSPSGPSVLEIRGSAYVSGPQAPAEIRIEIAEGYDVTDSDFELLAAVDQEVQDGLLYTWDATQYPLGVYTLRVVTDFGSYSTEDRNQIAFIQYDYKTVLRMSLTRILGFDSLLVEVPETSEGYVFTPKSYFNRFLYEYNESTDEYVSLVQYPTGEFNGVINFPNTSPSFINDNVWYRGFVQSDIGTYQSEFIPVFSPNPFTVRSLASFDSSRAGEDYLTYPFLDIGEQKSIHPHEKEVLCHLGFAVEGASDICEQYTPIPVTDYKTFSASDPFVCIVPGINDLFRGVAPLVNSQSQFPGAGAHILKRLIFDATDEALDGVVLGPVQCPTNLTSSFGGGLISSLARRTVSFFFNDTVQSSRQARYNVVATDSEYTANLSERRLSQDGRIVLWFCEHPYNYICNGNFEKGRLSQSIAQSYQGGGSSGNHLLQRLVADNWASIGTADLYLTDIAVQDYPHIGIPSNWWGQDENIFLPLENDPFNSRFAGFANTNVVSAGSDHREIIFTQLGQTFEVGQEYQIRFDVWSASVKSNHSLYNSNPNIGDHLLYVLGSDTQFTSASQILNEDGSVNVSNFDEVFVEINLDEVGAYDDWVTVSQNFVPSTEDISFIYLVSHSQLNDIEAMIASGKDSYSRYTNLDNFVIEPQLPYRDLRVEKNILTNPQVSLGQEVAFEVVVTNDSFESVDSIEVRDYLPEGFVFSNATSSQGQDFEYLSLEHVLLWEDITLEANESITFTVSGNFTACQGQFRNVAIAYSMLHLDETPENNFVDVYRQGFPFNDEIDAYTGFAGGEMGCVGTVSGRVFSDENQNGFQDMGESGIPDVVVGLYRQLSDGDFELEQTLFSSSQNMGVYTFSPQQQGVYAVQLVSVPDSQVTVPVDSTFLVEGLDTNYILEMASNVSYTERNFGIFKGRNIEGFVYEDLDNSGSYQVGEPLLSGVDIGLFSDEGDGYYEFIDAVLSGVDGVYEFEVPIQYQASDLLLRVYVPGDTGIQNISEPTFVAPVGHPNPDFVLDTYSIPANEPSQNPYVFGVQYEAPEPTVPLVFKGDVFQDMDQSASLNIPPDFKLENYQVHLVRELENGQYETILTMSTNANGQYTVNTSVPYGQYYVVLDVSHTIDTELTIPFASDTPILDSLYYYSVVVTEDDIDVEGSQFGLYVNPCSVYDFNGDSTINAGDLSELLAALGVNNVPNDINGDGVVDGEDVLMFMAVFGSSCDSIPLYALGGFAFNDVNTNGVYDEENIQNGQSAGIGGIPVYLYKQNNQGQYDLIDTVLTTFAQATPNIEVLYPEILNVPSQNVLSGGYYFTFSEPGQYAIVLDQGWEQEYSVTTPDSTSNPVNGSSRVHFVEIEPVLGEYINVMNYNFGITHCGCPGNFVGAECLIDSADVSYFNSNLIGLNCAPGATDCPGDFDGNNSVTSTDMFMMLSYFGCSQQADPLPNVYLQSVPDMDVFANIPGVSIVNQEFVYNSQDGLYERRVTIQNDNLDMFGLGQTFIPGNGITMTHVQPIGFEMNYVNTLSSFEGGLIGFTDNIQSNNMLYMGGIPIGESTFIFRFNPN